MKRVLLIEDLSCYGKCSMTVALPIFAVSEIEVVPLPTAIFSTHTGISKDSIIVDFSTMMKDFLNHYQGLSLRFDAILIGYSFGEEQIRKISKLLDELDGENKPLVLVDPAMADNGKMYGKLPPDYPGRMRELVKKADILTPNLTEALLLAGEDCSLLPTEQEAVTALMWRLYENYKKDIVITGIHTGGELLVLGISKGKLYTCKTPFMEKNFSGTGDAFASIFLAKYLKSEDFEKSMCEATKLTSLAVKNSIEKQMDNLYVESILKSIE